MKTKKYISLLPFVILLLSGVFSSCTDWLDKQPNDKQSEKQQFATKDGFYSAVNGIYNRMSKNNLYGKTMSYEMIDLLGQYYQVNQTSQDSHYEYLRSLCNWNYSNEKVTSTLESTWNEAYQTIMNINVILSNIEKDKEGSHILPDREYKMLKGEMLSARAMIHFDMLRMFGPIFSKEPEGRGIPYNESSKTELLPILNANNVLNDYIIRDLKLAEELLLNSDPVITDGPNATYNETDDDNSMRYRQLRMNYYATVLLTARAYLWGGDNANALTEALKLTDDPKVREFFPAIDPANVGNSYDPDRMFTTECLFGYYNKDRGNVYDYTFGGKSTGDNLLIPRPNYVQEKLFYGYGADNSDYRYSIQYEIGNTLVPGISSNTMVKFKAINDKGKDDAQGSGEENETAVLAASKFYGTFCSLIKLSEAYYIAAEVLGTTGSDQYNLPKAWDYLNAIRKLRGIPTYGTDSAEKIFQNLLTLEYIREFVGEGQKFFYFKRRNQGFDNDYNGSKEVVKITPSPMPGWIPDTYDYTDKATDAEKEKRFVIPLPKSELDNR